jgi:hypothetical protein
MRKLTLISALMMLAPLAVSAQHTKVFKWIDEDGVLHYGDSIPARYSEYHKEVLNEHGVKVADLAGKKTPEQIEAERATEKQRVVVALQLRADRALLATYLSVEEILMHRDRRVELFQAQSRVTELYLSNLEKRLTFLRDHARKFKPYSEDPDAPMISDGLAGDLRKTKDTIARHQRNLQKFQSDELRIIARFDGDISRFKILKGID